MFAYSTHIQTLLRGHKYALFSFRSSVRWNLEISWRDLGKRTGDVEVLGNEIL